MTSGYTCCDAQDGFELLARRSSDQKLWNPCGMHMSMSSMVRLTIGILGLVLLPSCTAPAPQVVNLSMPSPVSAPQQVSAGRDWRFSVLVDRGENIPDPLKSATALR